MKSAQEAMEEQASEYCIEHDISLAAKIDFKAGWKAATEYYKSCVFDLKISSIVEADTKIKAEGQQYEADYVPDFADGAIWQHSQDAAALGVARAEIEELNEQLHKEMIRADECWEEAKIFIESKPIKPK